MPTANAALSWAQNQLATLADPRREAALLLAAIINQPTTELFLHQPKLVISETDWEKFKTAVLERRNAKPVAYITGHKDFMDLTCLVSPATLIPRPDSECFLAALKKHLPSNYRGTIQDIGTGSGALALAVKQAFPQCKIIASDISRPALEIARNNFQAHKITGVKTKLCDLLDTQTQIHVVLANLPYIPRDKYAQLEQAIRLYEPAHALISGTNGLQHYYRLFNQIISLPPRRRPQYVLVECDPVQIRPLVTVKPQFQSIYNKTIGKALDGQPRLIIFQKI